LEKVEEARWRQKRTARRMIWIFILLLAGYDW
jgi:hypothetical protein